MVESYSGRACEYAQLDYSDQLRVVQDPALRRRISSKRAASFGEGAFGCSEAGSSNGFVSNECVDAKGFWV